MNFEQFFEFEREQSQRQERLDKIADRRMLAERKRLDQIELGDGDGNEQERNDR